MTKISGAFSVLSFIVLLGLTGCAQSPVRAVVPLPASDINEVARQSPLELQALQSRDFQALKARSNSTGGTAFLSGSARGDAGVSGRSQRTLTIILKFLDGKAKPLSTMHRRFNSPETLGGLMTLLAIIQNERIMLTNHRHNCQKVLTSLC